MGTIHTPYNPHTNQLYEDLALEHEKIIWGVVFHALREITGKDATDDKVRAEIGLDKNLVLIFPDHKRFFRVQWRGEDIVIVHRPEEVKIGKDTVQRMRRIDEPWKARWKVLH